MDKLSSIITGALAGLCAETASHRRAFVSAIKTHPRAAEFTPATAEAVRSARKAFTRALRAAQMRDKAAAHGC